MTKKVIDSLEKWQAEGKPFYIWYLSQHGFLGRMRLRFKWFLTSLRVLKRHIGYKIKYGLSYRENVSIQEE
jgi:hypothetical protein